MGQTLLASAKEIKHNKAISSKDKRLLKGDKIIHLRPNRRITEAENGQQGTIRVRKVRFCTKVKGIIDILR